MKPSRKPQSKQKTSIKPASEEKAVKCAKNNSSACVIYDTIFHFSSFSKPSDFSHLRLCSLRLPKFQSLAMAINFFPSLSAIPKVFLTPTVPHAERLPSSSKSSQCARGWGRRVDNLWTKSHNSQRAIFIIEHRMRMRQRQNETFLIIFLALLSALHSRPFSSHSSVVKPITKEFSILFHPSPLIRSLSRCFVYEIVLLLMNAMREKWGKRRQRQHDD